MMLSARNSSPFTTSQRQELEHQALIFKYMISGIPIPADLIYTVKRSLDSSMSARLFPHQPVGWGCFQVGFGRKADPEPGRCRRTDGKKWRCSKEAFPDSKYCERHMHRGKNRSRKPVEVINTTHSSTPTIPSNTLSPSSINPTTSSSYSLYPLSSSSSMASDQTQPHHHPYHSTPLYPFIYPHSSFSRPPPSGLLSPLNNTNHHQFLDSGSYPHFDKDYRYVHSMREGVDERAFFPEASGTVRGLPESYTPLAASTSSGYSHSQFQGLTVNPKQQQQQQQEQHCFVLGTDFKSTRPIKAERDQDDETQRPLHHFFNEWPQKINRDSWLDLEDDPSTHSSFSTTTQLSISLPMSSHELLASNSKNPY